MNNGHRIAVLFTLCVLPFFTVVAQEFHIDDSSILAHQTVGIDCLWDFYPRIFIDPCSVCSAAAVQVPVPGLWNDYGLGMPFDAGPGSGSFRIKITGLRPDTEYAFNIFDQAATAMTVYANGVYIASCGKPSEVFLTTFADQQMRIATFKSTAEGVVDLVLHVSNNFHRNGGVWSSLQLGEELFLQRQFTRLININFTFFGMLLIVVIYHISLFIFRKYDFASLYLALFVLVILCRIVSSGFSILKIYVPSFPYETLLRLEYTALFLGPVFFVLYMRKQAEKNVSKKILNAFVVIGLVFAILVYCFPITVACRLVRPCQIYTILSTLYVIIILIYSYIRRKSSVTHLMMLSSIVLCIGTIHDVLALSFVPVFLPDVRFISYAFIIFIFLQSAITAYQHELAQSAIDKLSISVAATNKAYYRFVPHEFLALLSKRNITDVHLGEWTVRNMTLLCADIRNFTTISESLDGKDVFNFLNRYLMRIAPIIRNYHGFIEKYLGDGIIALFSENGDDAMHCALEMQRELQQLRDTFAHELLPCIEVGIGLHYGKIVLGTVGDHNRMNEITISKAIETVMTLESLTKVYKVPIIASKSIVDQTSSADSYQLTVLDPSKNEKSIVKEPLYAVSVLMDAGDV